VITIPLEIESRRRNAYWQAAAALFGTIVVAGLVWFAVNRGLRVDELRKDLITTVSHEIKTPVASIRALTETLTDNAQISVDRRDEYLRLVGQENDRIGALADSFLTMSRLESGSYSIQPEVAPLIETIQDAAEITRPVFENKQGEILIDVSAELKARFDAEALKIILTNLFHNAAKYGGSPPTCRVSARFQKARVLISVTDNGPGIEPSEEHAVFRKFYRHDAQLNTGQRGIGLGLAICRRLANRMKGRITAKNSSQPEEGAIFTLTLPS
ncbi:MAG: HAMP domain-containing sensor histidine kinase, partial [Verrucomicrobiota bacterium]